MNYKNDLLSRLIEFNQEMKLKDRISQIENDISDKDRNGLERTISQNDYSKEFLHSALQVKEIAGEINVLIHYYGIIMSLPHILEDGELIEEVSLGAGNTGKDFDLTTNRRIAEFKFIHWKGSDTIRQNTTFKDYFYLAEEDTLKKKMFVLN